MVVSASTAMLSALATQRTKAILAAPFIGAVRRSRTALIFPRSLLARRAIFVTRGYLGRIPTLEPCPGRVWARHATRRGLLDLDDDGDVLLTKPSRDTEWGARRGALSKEPRSKE